MNFKKAILMLIILGFVTDAIAQRHLTTTAWNHLRHNELDQAKEAIDKAADHSQTRQDARTWFYRGSIYIQISQSEDFMYLHDNPLLEAYESFKNAIKYDRTNRYRNEVLQSLQQIAFTFYNAGAEFYGQGDFINTATNFDRYIEAISIIDADAVDTAAYFFSGYAYYMSENYDKSIKRLQKAMELQFHEPATALLLSEMFLKKGDTSEALSILKNGRKIYPGNQDIILSELNIYIELDRMDDAITNLIQAIEQEPGNIQLYLVLGTAYQEQEKIDKALEIFKEVIEKDSENFEAHYNTGAIYFNYDADIANKAAAERNRDKIAEFRKQYESYFKKAMPYLEKAHELNKDDHNTMISLQQIYLRLGNEAKANQMNSKLEKIFGTE